MQSINWMYLELHYQFQGGLYLRKFLYVQQYLNPFQFTKNISGSDKTDLEQYFELDLSKKKLYRVPLETLLIRGHE